MPYPSLHIPTYRHHKARGIAVVTLNGKDIYLGLYGSSESRQEYDRLIKEWLASGRTRTADVAVDEEAFSVAELIVAYLEEAKVIYRKDGRPTSHLHNVEDAMSYLKQLYGLEAVKHFGPLKLKAVRQQMIDKKLSRTTINKYIGCLKRMFKWSTENELVPANVFHALQAISGLRKGRSEAKENAPIKPVPDAHIAAVKPYVSKPVEAMIDLQLITGMRPGEVVMMRGCDIDTTGGLWIYTPEHHKTEHHGCQRPVYLGPKAQQIIKPYLRTDPTAWASLLWLGEEHPEVSMIGDMVCHCYHRRTTFYFARGDRTARPLRESACEMSGHCGTGSSDTVSSRSAGDAKAPADGGVDALRHCSICWTSASRGGLVNA